MKKITFYYILIFLFVTNISFAQNGHAPPGIVINHISKNEKIYIGGPNIVILPDGSYVAIHCEFGPNANVRQSPANNIFRSTDKGRTWTKIAVIKPCFESTMFLHNGDLYILGTDVLYGNLVIRKSTDKGYTWTTPADKTSGLLFEGEYLTTSTPWAIYNGRIWHDISIVVKNLNHYPWEDIKPVMLSAPINDDLLNADNWLLSNSMPGDSTYMNGKFLGWAEGNAVIAPDGKLRNIMRVRILEGDEYIAIAELSDDGKTMSFNPETGFVKFQGGDKKFVIRYDKKSKRYWSLVNYIMPEYRHLFPSGIRNAQALCSSKDLREWTYHKIVLFHPDVAEDGINLGGKTGRHGFQYVDWQIEDNDIIFVSRTAFDDETGGANNYHDANYLTFHRIKKFRDLQSLNIESETFNTVVGKQTPPVNIIFDTDMDSDCDDAGALALLHHYVDRKMANLLGVIYSSGKNRYGVGVCDAINTYYGRGDTPLGHYKNSDVGDPRDNYAKVIATDKKTFPHNVIDSTEDMLVVYKRILEAQPDNSVTIVTVGHPHALALLMDDADGIKLLCKKVQKCVSMTGADIKPSKSWNFTENGVAPYTRKILANFPAPMYFSPYGTTVITGNRLLPATPADNPVREAYRLWNNALNTGRMSWDHIAVIYAVEPQLFDEDTVGELVMTDDNKIYWNKNANNARHIKVTPKITDEELSQKIETMMAISPLVKVGEAQKIHELN